MFFFSLFLFSFFLLAQTMKLAFKSGYLWESSTSFVLINRQELKAPHAVRQTPLNACSTLPLQAPRRAENPTSSPHVESGGHLCVLVCPLQGFFFVVFCFLHAGPCEAADAKKKKTTAMQMSFFHLPAMSHNSTRAKLSHFGVLLFFRNVL